MSELGNKERGEAGQDRADASRPGRRYRRRGRAALFSDRASACSSLAALVPLVADGYALQLSISIVMYTALATSWLLFSGPTNYIALSTAAFFGIGMYTVAGGIDIVPYPVLIARVRRRRRGAGRRRRASPRCASPASIS